MTDRQRLALAKQIRADYRHTAEGYLTHPTGPQWRKVEAGMARLIADLDRKPVPALGPVLEDGLPILLLAPTHNTDGVPNHPAFDAGFGQAGRWVLAPEFLTVTQQSSAQGGDAVYAKGRSGINYWIGHISPAPATGRQFKKGERMSRVADQAGTDHVHWGLDVRALTGGVGLAYGRDGDGPDYTWGSPTIGAQLTKLMAAV